MHHQPHGGIHSTAGDDAAQGHIDLWVGPLARVARGRNHHPNEGKRRAQVTGHAPTGDGKKQQRAQAAHEHCQVGIKAHQDGGQHRRAKHGDDVLQPHQTRLRPRQTLVWGNHPAALQRLRWALLPVEPSHGESFFFQDRGGNASGAGQVQPRRGQAGRRPVSWLTMAACSGGRRREPASTAWRSKRGRGRVSVNRRTMALVP